MSTAKSQDMDNSSSDSESDVQYIDFIPMSEHKSLSILDKMNLLTPHSDPKFIPNFTKPLTLTEVFQRKAVQNHETIIPDNSPDIIIQKGSVNTLDPPSPFLKNGQINNANQDQLSSSRGARSSVTSGRHLSQHSPSPWKKIKVIKGLVEKKKDPISILTTQKAIDLIHDKAFSKYDKEEIINKDLKSKRRNGLMLKSMLQKHAIYGERAADTQILTIAVSRMKYLKKSFFGKIGYIVTKRIATLKIWFKVYMREKYQGFIRPLKPDSLFRFLWDFVSMLFIVHDLVIVPMDLCFEDNFEAMPWLDFIAFIGTFFFMCDIVLNFNTAYVEDSNLVDDRIKIIKRYLKLWFWIDLISSFPYTWVVEAMSTNQVVFFSHNTTQVIQIVRLTRLIKIIRIVRIAKLKQIIEKVEEILQSSVLLNGILSLMKLSVFISFLAHCCACVWYLVGSSSDGDCWLNRAGVNGASLRDRYVAALYFSVTTMMTVGYGDISPVNSNERIAGIFLMLLGGGTFGYSLNRIATIAQSIEGERSKFNKKMYTITRFMNRKGLPKDIQSRVKKYLEFTQENDDGIKPEEALILDSLSIHLREEIYKQINGKFLNESVTLKKNFSSKLIYLLSLQLEERIFPPNELIFDKSSSEFALCFVSKGKVGIYYDRFDYPLETFEKGGYFGEISFFSKFAPPAITRSINFSQIIYLTLSDFLFLLQNHEFDRQAFHMIKDSLDVYENFSILSLKCSVCERMGHSSFRCPKIHFVSNRISAIQHYIKDTNNFMKCFKRKNRKKIDARLSMKEVKTRAEKARGKFLSFVTERTNTRNSSFSHAELFNSRVEWDLRKMELGGTNSLAVVPSHKDVRGSPERLTSESKVFNRKSNFGTIMSMIHADNAQELEYQDFEMDKMRNYEIYFPENNFNKIMDAWKDKINRKKDMSFTFQEIQYLKGKLAKFFEKRRRKALKEQRIRNKSAETGDIKRRKSVFSEF